eukprot:UN11071
MPNMNQIEVNPFMYRKTTIDYCAKQGIAIQAYRGLTNGKNRTNENIVKLAKKYKKTETQILGAWLMNHKFIHIPKTENLDRMKENANR